jgi:hypothetical protein
MRTSRRCPRRRWACDRPGSHLKPPQVVKAENKAHRLAEVCEVVVAGFKGRFWVDWRQVGPADADEVEASLGRVRAVLARRPRPDSAGGPGVVDQRGPGLAPNNAGRLGRRVGHAGGRPVMMVDVEELQRFFALAGIWSCVAG